MVVTSISEIGEQGVFLLVGGLAGGLVVAAQGRVGGIYNHLCLHTST